ncbi:MAG: 2,4'-dihydroxyacetophenone dioxygenase family protein [Acidimicrobiia bacterium]
MGVNLPPGNPGTHHRGVDEMPYVSLRDGSHIALLHVDHSNNVWIARQRLEPGTVLTRHLHTGPVHLVTLAGKWKYAEYDVWNTAGSYLFEPAGSVHTFTVPADNTEMTEIWFSITGSNVNLDDDDNVVSIFDARTISAYYERECRRAGYEVPDIIKG